jgi:hypothetical protein
VRYGDRNLYATWYCSSAWCPSFVSSLMRQELQERVFSFLLKNSTQSTWPHRRTVQQQTKKTASRCRMCSKESLFSCAHFVSECWPLATKEENILRKFEIGILRKLYGPGKLNSRPIVRTRFNRELYKPNKEPEIKGDHKNTIWFQVLIKSKTHRNIFINMGLQIH